MVIPQEHYMLHCIKRNNEGCEAHYPQYYHDIQHGHMIYITDKDEQNLRIKHKTPYMAIWQML